MTGVRRHGLPCITLVLFLGVPLGMVGCGDDQLGMVPTPDAGPSRCTSDDECPDRFGCNESIGVCFPLDDCGPDDPCDDPEQVCMDADGDGFLDCVFPRCADASECTDTVCPPDEIVVCVAGRCQCGTPCQGGCPANQGCCIPDDTCRDLPPQCGGMTCPPGQFISVTSTGAWDTGMCAVLGETCECVRLPPLPEGDIGLHSAIAHDGQTAVASAYNLDYGDLMFGVQQSDGSINWEFVDGVPSSTTAITGDVDGPRGGFSEPGADVGTYTDIAVDPSGRPHIVYYDRTNGALRYAVGPSWQLHTVETRGEAGLYASLTFDIAGHPRIAYLAAREDKMGTRVTTLRLAVSSTTTPVDSTAWSIRDVEELDLAPFGCAEQCRTGEVCRASNLSCVTPDPARRCNNGNGCPDADTRCIGGGCRLVEPLPAFRDLPMARGLWPSIQTLADGTVFIAYYDRVDRNLKIARLDGPNPAASTPFIEIIDGLGSGEGMDDVGQFPSLYITPGGEIHVAYMNVNRRSVVYRNLDQQLMTLFMEEIETGLGMGSTPGGNLVGADPALVVDASGIVRVAFQNATAGSVRYARREGPDSWNIVTIRGDEMPYEGSFGFYCDQTLDPSRSGPQVSTYRYLLSQPNGNGLEILTPP